MSRVIPPLLQTHLQEEVITLASCIQITKSSGVVLRFTTHDAEISVNGDVYIPYPIQISAIQSNSDLTVDNADMTLGIDEDIVKTIELKSEDYTSAQFDLFSVNWQSPLDGVISIKRGTLGSITITENQFAKIQLRGLTQGLQKQVVDKYSATCRAALGSKQCGYSNLPTKIRRPKQKLTTWNWFLEPNNNVTNDVITNPSFESGLTGWTPVGNWASNSVFTGSNGAYYAEASAGNTGDSLYLYREFTTSSMGISNTDIDAGKISVDVSALAARTGLSVNSCRLNIEQRELNDKTTKAETSDWYEPDFQTWEGVGITVFLVPKTRKFRLQLIVRIDEGTSGGVAFDDVKMRHWLNQANTFSNVLFRTMRIPSYMPDEAGTIANFNFETLPLVANSDATAISGWTRAMTDFFQTVASSGPVIPVYGANMLVGGDDGSNTQKTYALSQIVDFNTSMTAASSGNISDGWYLSRARVWISRLDATSVGKITLSCLNAANTVLGTKVTVADPSYAMNAWQPVEVALRIPAGTTKVKVELSATSPVGSSAANVAFDYAQVHYLCTAYENAADLELGKLAYDTPSLSYTLGTYGIDGAHIIQTRPVTFGYATVAAASDKRGFAADSTMIGTAATFYSGRIVWLSGKNAGRSSYIRTFDNTLKTVRLYQDLPYAPEVGDYFVHSQGCDKTIGRCGGSYGNASNFRGEPYLPGAARILQFFT
jgi:hypothetical protein